MDQVREVLRYHHYAYRTEQTYCDWIVRFIRFHNAKKHPKNMGKNEIEAFLSGLAVNQNVSATIQKQALNAIVFLYKRVLDKPIEGLIEHTKAKRRQPLPVVMSESEVQQVLSNIIGTHQLMAKLLYGGGLRLMECVRLRVRDLDFSRRLIYIRAAKGGKHRTTLFPKAIHARMAQQIEIVKQLHKENLEKGYGEVYMPQTLSRKYKNAARKTAGKAGNIYSRSRSLEVVSTPPLAPNLKRPADGGILKIYHIFIRLEPMRRLFIPCA